MRLKLTFATLIAAALLAANAKAALVFDLVIDPATTAFNGIAADGGFTGTSTRSGAGTYHLYALDDTAGSLGIANYSVGLLGTVTAVNHRSPTTNGQDENADNFASGFHLGRTGTGGNPLQGSQAPTDLSPFQVMGFGKEASNFSAKISAPNTVVGPTTNGLWGNYATDSDLTGTNGGRWLFIGEGTYTGAAPTFNTALTTAQHFTGTNVFVNSEICLGAVPCLQGGVTNDPPVATDFVIPQAAGYNANEPGEPQTISQQLAASDPNVGDVLSFTLGSLTYQAAYGAELGNPVPTGPLFAPTLSNTGLFNWVTEGSPRGIYTWSYTVADNGTPSLSDTANIEIHVTAVPEPSTLALFGLAMVGGLGLFRRRNG